MFESGGRLCTVLYCGEDFRRITRLNVSQSAICYTANVYEQDTVVCECPEESNKLRIRGT